MRYTVTGGLFCHRPTRVYMFQPKRKPLGVYRVDRRTPSRAAAAARHMSPTRCEALSGAGGHHRETTGVLYNVRGGPISRKNAPRRRSGPRSSYCSPDRSSPAGDLATTATTPACTVAEPPSAFVANPAGPRAPSPPTEDLRDGSAQLCASTRPPTATSPPPSAYRRGGRHGVEGGDDCRGYDGATAVPHPAEAGAPQVARMELAVRLRARAGRSPRIKGTGRPRTTSSSTASITWVSSLPL